jgi:transcriptional regulator with XRE-family HTH domain
MAMKGLSARDTSKLCGVDPTTVSLLSNDRQKAQLKTLGKLAKGLGVELEDLLDLLDTTAQARGYLGQEARQKKEKEQAQPVTALPIVPQGQGDALPVQPIDPTDLGGFIGDI